MALEESRRRVDAFLTTNRSSIPIDDLEHAVRCATFADALYSALAAKLELAEDDRSLAIAAALWHDAGYARSARDHARKSYDIIREARVEGMADDKRLIIACVARYHRPPLPNIEHAGFGDLSFNDQRRVRRLSAIVRVAVALDASHRGLVHDLEIQVDGLVKLTVFASSDIEVERDRLAENGAAFSRLTYLPFRFDIVVDRAARK